jgi:hypothetical protein
MEEDTVWAVATTTIARTVAAEKDVVTFEVAAIMDEVAGTIGISEVVAEEDMAVAEEDVDIVVEGEGGIDECRLQSHGTPLCKYIEWLLAGSFRLG